MICLFFGSWRVVVDGVWELCSWPTGRPEPRARGPTLASPGRELSLTV